MEDKVDYICEKVPNGYISNRGIEYVDKRWVYIKLTHIHLDDDINYNLISWGKCFANRDVRMIATFSLSLSICTYQIEDYPFLQFNTM